MRTALLGDPLPIAGKSLHYPTVVVGVPQVGLPMEVSASIAQPHRRSVICAPVGMPDNSTTPTSAAAPRTKDAPEQTPVKKKQRPSGPLKRDAPKAPKPGRGVAPGITG